MNASNTLPDGNVQTLTALVTIADASKAGHVIASYTYSGAVQTIHVTPLLLKPFSHVREQRTRSWLAQGVLRT